ATTRDVGGAPNVDLGYHAGKNWTVATPRRLTPTIAFLANLHVKVATNGADINCRECRSANCRRVRLCRRARRCRLEPAAAIVRQYREQFRRRVAATQANAPPAK